MQPLPLHNNNNYLYSVCSLSNYYIISIYNNHNYSLMKLSEVTPKHLNIVNFLASVCELEPLTNITIIAQKFHKTSSDCTLQSTT